jgi:hypothetical protein
MKLSTRELWLESLRGKLTPGLRSPVIHWIGVWEEPRAKLDLIEEKSLLSLPNMKPWFLRHPTRNLTAIPNKPSLLGRNSNILPSNHSKDCITDVCVILFILLATCFGYTAIFRPTYKLHIKVNKNGRILEFRHSLTQRNGYPPYQSLLGYWYTFFV